MTKTTLSGQKIAIMVATGFEEKNFVEIQKMLIGQNAQLRVISASTGLVQGRTGTQLGSLTLLIPSSQKLSQLIMTP